MVISSIVHTRRQVGDRIGISPTEKRATGYGEVFTIVSIDSKGSLTLNKAAK
jgi:hypothetical protein